MSNNGLGPNGRRFQQVRTAAAAGRGAVGINPEPCDDPAMLSVARTLACAIRDARPVITMPPHLFMPWRAQPFLLESRFILNGSATQAVVDGAAAAASANGVPQVTEVGGFNRQAQFVVPGGTIAIVRQWGAQTDDGGYFIEDGNSDPVVQFRLHLGEENVIFPPSLLGNVGTLDRPFEVSYAVPASTPISVDAQSTDANMWHWVETFVSGYLVQTNDINETLNSLLDSCRDEGR